MLTTPTGIVSWSHFPDGSSRPKDLKTSPSIVQALERSEFEKAMVEDSDSFSGLSILFLPSILALLPIAAFQDAGMVATNLYAVATDIVRAMPIVIKGIELAVCGSRRHYAFNANMYGVQNSTGAAEIWAAFCAMKPFVRHRGIALFSLGVSVMVLGIALEVVATRFAERRKNRKDTSDEERLALQPFFKEHSS